MRGSMRQRSPGSWELRVFAGRDPGTGRRRYRTATIRANRAEAERHLAALVASVLSQREVGASSPVSDLLEAWLGIASTTWAPATVRQTRSVLDRYLHPHIGTVAVCELITAAIDALYAHLRSGGGMRGAPLATGTVARVHVVLRSALSQAQRWGWIWDNPAERAHRMIASAPELHPPTPDELRPLLDAVHHDQVLRLFVMLAAFTGARRAQLLGLRWHGVALDTGRVSFTAGWVEGPHGPVLADTKTKRRHSVDLDPGTLAALRGHAARCRAANRDSSCPRHSCSATTPAEPRRGNRTAPPKRSCGPDAPPGCGSSGCTTSATSWPPKCSTPASPSPSSPAASTTAACPPPWTATPTPYPAETPKPPRRCGRASMTPEPSPGVEAYGITTMPSRLSQPTCNRHYGAASWGELRFHGRSAGVAASETRGRRHRPRPPVGHTPLPPAPCLAGGN